MQVKEAIILAGGLGTRLRDAVPDLPKSMAPIRDKPFLSYLLDYLLTQKIEKFILSLGYRHELVEEYVYSVHPDLDIKCSIEEEPLGTGGAIRLACELVDERQALVVNGDTYFNVNVHELAGFHNLHKADCTLALKPMKNFDRYGVVEVSEEGRVKYFREKKFYAQGFINGGIYLLNVPGFLKEELPEKFSFEKDYLEKFCGQRKVYGFVQDDYFIDIGIPVDYEKAKLELPGRLNY